ncbi:hypothetical protein HU200_015012 [Digitaria exilis]|uniref:Late embryogenesis abundant protein LEA-2 subgroup domain-containing protein n=1 Tax=Digitaria exilis TaxID=1010633 RepID=A0A835F9M7_9POAL|nr:hypothetical protein HU200_015012 [Digitaria exilis]CAB3469285.1 unnamed protein product [Digitaria exilis]
MAAAVDGKKSRFRCIDAARYVLAFVVTLLIVTVIVIAIQVVRRPDVLHVSVAGSTIYAEKLLLLQPPTLDLSLTILADNPSGRVRMYYHNISVHLFDNKTLPTTPNQDFYSMGFFGIPDIVVPQIRKVSSYVHANAINGSFDSNYFKFLYDDPDRQIRGVTLRLDGELVTEVSSGPKANRTVQTTYFCDNLLLGGDPNDLAFKGSPDVICKNELTTT